MSRGADSMFGFGGELRVSSATGNAAAGYGSGGSGASSVYNDGSFQGGVGAGGVVVVTEHYI